MSICQVIQTVPESKGRSVGGFTVNVAKATVIELDGKGAGPVDGEVLK
ncbi:MAG: hypothetical protein P8J91_01420 [Pirellulaceae bacterium]|nr:hypothetical protein [Pirellulaceae bacterium]MDG2102380.1 hypothetical protein [Pirellulaceae bacterium]